MTPTLQGDILSLLENDERPAIAPKLGLFSTKMVFLEQGAFLKGRYDVHIQRARDHIVRQAAETALYLSSQVEFKLFHKKGVRVQLHLRNQDKFNKIVRNFDNIPSIEPTKEPFDHFLYLDIASHSLYKRSEEYSEELASQLGELFTDPYRGRLREVSPADMTTAGYNRDIPVRTQLPQRK